MRWYLCDKICKTGILRDGVIMSFSIVYCHWSWRQVTKTTSQSIRNTNMGYSANVQWIHTEVTRWIVDGFDKNNNLKTFRRIAELLTICIVFNIKYLIICVLGLSNICKVLEVPIFGGLIGLTYYLHVYVTGFCWRGHQGVGQ